MDLIIKQELQAASIPPVSAKHETQRTATTVYRWADALHDATSLRRGVRPPQPKTIFWVRALAKAVREPATGVTLRELFFKFHHESLWA